MGVALTSIRPGMILHPQSGFFTNQVTTARCLLATGGPSGVLLRGNVKPRPQAQKTTARIRPKRRERTAAMEAVATGWSVFGNRWEGTAFEPKKGMMPTENLMQHVLCWKMFGLLTTCFVGNSNSKKLLYRKIIENISLSPSNTTSVQVFSLTSQNAIKTRRSQNMQLFKKS